MEPLNIRFLARSNYVSESYLGRLFHRETGMTYASYLHSVRIRYAEKELIESEKSVTEIACRCGYENVSYFNRVFHRITGKTPTEYRRRFHKTQGMP